MSRLSKKLLIIIEDTFQVSGQGLILSPGLPLSQWETQLKGGHLEAKFLFKRPSSGKLIAKGIIFYPLPKPTPLPADKKVFICLPSLYKNELPIGSEVWFIKESNNKKILELPGSLQKDISILLDPNADLGTRNDIAMDLAEENNIAAENALLSIAYNGNENFLQEVVGESIGTIWVRKKSLHIDQLIKFTSQARYSALRIIANDNHLLKLIFEHIVTKQVTMFGLVKDVFEIYLHKLTEAYNKNKSNLASYCAEKAFQIAAPILLKSKSIDFYNLSLAIYLNKSSEEVILLAHSIKKESSFSKPVSEYDHFVYMIVNFLTNIICKDYVLANEYFNKISRLIDARYSEFSEYKIIFYSIVNEKYFEALRQTNKLQLKLLNVPRKRLNKIQQFGTFFFFVRIVLIYISKIGTTSG